MRIVCAGHFKAESGRIKTGRNKHATSGVATSLETKSRTLPGRAVNARSSGKRAADAESSAFRDRWMMRRRRITPARDFNERTTKPIA